jgi:hypothetical protein
MVAGTAAAHERGQPVTFGDHRGHLRPVGEGTHDTAQPGQAVMQARHWRALWSAK